MSYWLIERKAAYGQPAAWWTGGREFGRAMDCWTTDTTKAVRFCDAPSATTAHIALMALANIHTSFGRSRHLDRVTISEHLDHETGTPQGDSNGRPQ